MEPESFPHFCFLLVILSLIILQLGDKVALKTNGCNGSIAECNEEYEFVMPSRISERYLEETKKYISPGTLKPDQPVCNGGASGQSYSSSCLPPPSNPPSRGCSKYYRCRSDD
ncbi:RAPID ALKALINIZATION FACTOR-LIKE [Salix koriyanagi]|uniref:RAPID ALKALINIZATION FACTOR-LIKE n=1 Tax=Salix koriyanagi TaxID=2511006 RepID=A0A9Q0X2Y5_9ROSI|nr:RAPID ALKALINIZATION FACTOR-LIKE [Salix koriyanagi]